MVTIDDLFAYCQPDACAWVLPARVQPLKDDEHTFCEFWRDADAVVFHRENPLAVSLLGAYFHLRWRFSTELDGIACQLRMTISASDWIKNRLLQTLGSIQANT